jgi:hypothetical protein
MAKAKSPNPQGKGQLPTLQALQEVSVGALPRRSREEWLLDYMAGALVLSARFAFKPVVGRAYYLYWKEGSWSLSMVSPQEWGTRLASSPVARCTLRSDLSWQLSALERPGLDGPGRDGPGLDGAGLDEEVSAALLAFQQAFRDQLDTDQPLADILPYHNDALPWYPRLMGLALAKTLQTSLDCLPAPLRSGRALLENVSRQRLLGPQ